MALSLPAGPYCRNSAPATPLLVTNSSTVTVLFNSTSHRSGRGLLLSYATSQHPGRGAPPRDAAPLGCVLAHGGGTARGGGSSWLTPGWAPIAPSSLKFHVLPGWGHNMAEPQATQPGGTPHCTLDPQVSWDPNTRQSSRCGADGFRGGGAIHHCPSGTGCLGAEVGAVGRVGVPHPGVSLPCRPGLLPGSRHPLHPGARQVSGQGV